jgi:hypothetical protein
MDFGLFKLPFERVNKDQCCCLAMDFGVFKLPFERVNKVQCSCSAMDFGLFKLYQVLRLLKMCVIPEKK